MAAPVTFITSEPRLRWIGITLLLAWSIGFVHQQITVKGLVIDREVVIGRDFKAFYLAGRIVLNGEGKQLYGLDQQWRTQTEILGSQEGLAYFVNPAPVAVLYSLPARLPYRVAYYLQIGLMLVCWVGGTWFLRESISWVKRNWWTIVILGAVYLPMMHTILGGQNAALTFFLLSWAYFGVTTQRQWAAGVALGLLLYKPQYALPFLGLLLLRRQGITVLTAGVIGAWWYVLGGIYCGWDWPLQMWTALHEVYRPNERLASGGLHISILEVLDYTVIRNAPLLQTWITILAYLLVVGIVGYLIWCWSKVRIPFRDSGIGVDSRLNLCWAMTVAAILLISPHTQYYESALLVLPALLILDLYVRHDIPVGSGVRLGLMLVFVAVGFRSASTYIHFQPLMLIPAWIMVWSARLMKHDSEFKKIPNPEE